MENSARFGYERKQTLEVELSSQASLLNALNESVEQLSVGVSHWKDKVDGWAGGYWRGRERNHCDGGVSVILQFELLSNECTRRQTQLAELSSQVNSTQEQVRYFCWIDDIQ